MNKTLTSLNLSCKYLKIIIIIIIYFIYKKIIFFKVNKFTEIGANIIINFLNDYDITNNLSNLIQLNILYNNINKKEELNIEKKIRNKKLFYYNIKGFDYLFNKFQNYFDIKILF
jgi:hypothetical protein